MCRRGGTLTTPCGSWEARGPSESGPNPPATGGSQAAGSSAKISPAQPHNRIQLQGSFRGGVHVSRQIELLSARRFLPLFAVQTTSSIADNLFKSAFIMLVTFGATVHTALDPGALSAIAGGLLIAPYFLFSALAGELADRYERSHLLRILKAAELATVVVAAAALLYGSLVLSLVALFALGMQVTFSSPVRYALLPQHLDADEL